MLLAAITLELPLVGALLAVVLTLLGGMWALTRLDNNRVIKLLTAENRVSLLEHTADCKARAAFAAEEAAAQAHGWSPSGKLIMPPGGG